MHNRHSAEDLAAAGRILKSLESVSLSQPIRTAALLATKALSDPTLEFRSLLMWLAMECLFGPADGREISFRLAQRMAFFLESDRTKAEDTFKLVKYCYHIRSKMVHGFKVTGITDEEITKFCLDSENLLRKSLVTVLRDASTIASIDGKGREAYLDGLVFK